MSAGAIGLFPLRFADPRMQARYRGTEDGKSVRVLRIGVLAGIGLIMLGAVAIQLVAPKALVGDANRPEVVLFMCLALLASLAVTFVPSFTRYPQFAVALFAILVAPAIVVMLRELSVEFATNRGFMLLVLHTFTIYSLLRLRVLPAVLAGWLSFSLYVLCLLAWNVISPVAVLRQAFWIGAANVWGMWICHQLELGARREFAARAALDRERARSEELLLSILPAPIAARLKDSREAIAEHRNEVTVVFADIVGFTPLSARLAPAELVKLLDAVFTRFDTLAHEHGLEKIKTIGDAYMAVAGLPEEQPDHALRAARMALEMVGALRDAAAHHGESLQLRVGVHSGPVVAGVIGRSKFSYDLWGDTVNTASRMESMGVPGAVQVSSATAAFLATEFALQSRGSIEVKGKGRMETFLLARLA